MPNAIALSDARQPRYGAGINWGNPLTRGLVVAVHWGNLNRAIFNPALRRRGQATLGYTSGTNYTMSHRGGMHGMGSTAGPTTAAVVGNEEEAGLSGSTAFSIMRYRDNTTASRNGVIFGTDASNVTERFTGSGWNASLGAAFFDYGGTFGEERVTWTGLGGKNQNHIHRFCFVARRGSGTNGITLELWHDGARYAVNGGTGADRTSPTSNDFNAFNNDAGTIAQDALDIYLLLVWNRGLVGGEVKQLDHNPWQVFATSDIMRSFVPAAAQAYTLRPTFRHRFG